MTLMTVNDKVAALGKLYCPVMRIAKEMGGNATHQVRALTVPGQMTATRQSENVPALIVEMPDDFQVEFVPSFPLSLGSTLSVRINRRHAGYPKNEWGFKYSPDGWRKTQALLTDEEIRACLTPEGPPSH